MIIQTAVIDAAKRALDSTAQPDIRVLDGEEWQRLAHSGPSSGSAIRIPTGQLTLVCPDQDSNDQRPQDSNDQSYGCEN